MSQDLDIDFTGIYKEWTKELIYEILKTISSKRVTNIDEESIARDTDRIFKGKLNYVDGKGGVSSFRINNAVIDISIKQIKQWPKSFEYEKMGFYPDKQRKDYPISVHLSCPGSKVDGYNDDYIPIFEVIYEVVKGIYDVTNPIYVYGGNEYAIEDIILDDKPSACPLNLFSNQLVEWIGRENFNYLNVYRKETLSDNGIMVLISDNPFFGDVVGILETNVWLGLRKDIDFEKFQELIQYVDQKLNSDFEGFARELGFDEKIIEKSKRVSKLAGLDDEEGLKKLIRAEMIQNIIKECEQSEFD